MHSCVRWCFALKGQCHKIFSSKFFHESSSPKPHLWAYTICYIADLRHVWQFADLQFADPIFFVRFANPILVANLQLLQICKIFIFLFSNTYLKCSNSNFYQIKKTAKQTCNQLLDSFAIKGGNFKKRLSVLWWKTCRLEICSFAICGFAICGSTKRNLRTPISQKSADLWLRIEPKNLRIKKNSCSATFANLPLVLMIPVPNWHWYQRHWL